MLFVVLWADPISWISSPGQGLARNRSGLAQDAAPLLSSCDYPFLVPVNETRYFHLSLHTNPEDLLGLSPCSVMLALSCSTDVPTRPLPMDGLHTTRCTTLIQLRFALLKTLAVAYAEIHGVS